MTEEPAEIPVEGTDSAALRPENVPEKFWDPESGSVRVDALAASYRTLEQKLSSAVATAEPDKTPSIAEADQTVESAPEYQIEIGHDLFEAHPGVDEILRDAGFSQDQAQIVYDLAANVLQPFIDQYGGDRKSMADEARLQQQFGGGEKWTETQRQLRLWGRRHLPRDAYESLSSSYDGVIALHRLMGNQEPAVLRGGAVSEALDEGTLRRMIRDPRYWRDRDPAIVAKVRDGFKRLYPEG